MPGRSWGFPHTTILFGWLLILLGAVGYLATGRSSITALIPAFLGVVLAVLGRVAWARPGARKTAMHIAVLFAVLGVVGAARGVPGMIRMLSGTEVARPAAVISQTIMALICLTFVALGVRSFVKARLDRTAGGEPPP
jgi:hypothetical protein